MLKTSNNILFVLFLTATLVGASSLLFGNIGTCKLQAKMDPNTLIVQIRCQGTCANADYTCKMGMFDLSWRYCGCRNADEELDPDDPGATGTCFALVQWDSDLYECTGDCSGGKTCREKGLSKIQWRNACECVLLPPPII